jgi:spermidine synthase
MALPWETLASVSTPDGALDLRRRGEKDFLITIGGRILMSSAAHRSEDALAKLACAGLRKKRRARVLVSGLGMGFTLRAALDELADDAEVIVAELNPAVVEWCKGPLAKLTAGAARDPRVTIEVVDVERRIAAVARDKHAPRFDAVVLDMYQGPQHLVRADEPFYGHVAVRRTKEALSPGGTFAIWCEGASTGFEANLRGAGFHYRLERAGRGGARIHCVYIASETAPPPTRPAARGPARGPRPKKD